MYSIVSESEIPQKTKKQNESEKFFKEKNIFVKLKFGCIKMNNLRGDGWVKKKKKLYY